MLAYACRATPSIAVDMRLARGDSTIPGRRRNTKCIDIVLIASISPMARDDVHRDVARCNYFSQRPEEHNSLVVSRREVHLAISRHAKRTLLVPGETSAHPVAGANQNYPVWHPGRPRPIGEETWACLRQLRILRLSRSLARSLYFIVYGQIREQLVQETMYLRTLTCHQTI